MKNYVGKYFVVLRKVKSFPRNFTVTHQTPFSLQCQNDVETYTIAPQTLYTALQARHVKEAEPPAAESVDPGQTPV